MKKMLLSIISILFIYQLNAQIHKIPYSGTNVTVIISGSIYYPNGGPQWDDAIYGVVVLYIRNGGDGSITTGNIYEGTNYYKTNPDTLQFTSNSDVDSLYVFGLDWVKGAGVGETLTGQYNVNVNGVDYVLTPDNVVYLLPCNTVGINDRHNADINNFLKQNFPNPLYHSTTIKFSVKNSDFVKVDIFDVSGKLIKNLVDKKMTQGEYSVIWKGDDNKGNSVSAGTYFYQIRTGDLSQSKTMILLK
jgi:hypothetical protein